MDKKTEIDYLIVGQGVAGTLMSHFLLEAGKTVYVVDNHHKGSSSKIAAGIINPITGRRYVKSWMIEQLMPIAKNTYHQLEAQLNIIVYREKNIIRALFNSREENDWLARSGDPSYEPYMKDEVDLGTLKEKTEPAFSYGESLKTAQVDLPHLISSYRKYLLDENCFLEEQFDFTQLKHSPEQIEYKGIQARHIIFCEGSQGKFNPYFSYLPFNPAKGEILMVKIPDANFEKLYKHRVFIVPFGDDLYWVGTTNEWEFDHDEPTEEAKSFLIDRIEDILKVPYEIVTHQAAIRPTVKDRRPFIGVHPVFPNMCIFNGLGTKGASLGPYWAKHFVEVLLKSSNLDQQVDINRFESFYANQDETAS